MVTGEGSDQLNGGRTKGVEIKEQIAALREDLPDSKFSMLYGKTLIDPKKASRA